MEIAYVGLGANLESPGEQIQEALAKLEDVPGIQVRRRSSLKWTDPENGVEEPRYLNGVVELETTRTASELLEALLKIENELGRIRTEVRGPRTIDLDLLLFGSHQIQSARLDVPHPRMTRRRFVLEPLAELCPDMIVPGSGRTVHHHLTSLRERVKP